MLALVSAADVIEVCGEGLARNWLCVWTLRRTDDELLARAAGLAGDGAAIAAILAVAFVVMRLLQRVVSRFGRRMERQIEDRLERLQRRGAITDTQRFKTRRLQRLQAITSVLRGAVGVVVWLSALLVVIARLGIPLQPMLAGAGLVGIVLGFGAQQLVRDVLAGIAMLIEDQYGVGDWIEVDGQVGVVERVGLRSTGFRDVYGTMHHVLNGSVQRVGNLSQSWAQATFDVPLALDTHVPTARGVIWRVATELVEDPVWGRDVIGPPEIWGVQELGPQGLAIRVVIPTKPLRNWDLVRQLRERLKPALDEAGMRMPSQLVDVGGMPTGYAVLTRELRGREPGWLVPRRADAGSATDDPEPSEPDEERDQSRELRLKKGPRPRPD